MMNHSSGTGWTIRLKQRKKQVSSFFQLEHFSYLTLPEVLLNSKANGSQGRPDAESSMMSGQASPVAHLEGTHN